MKQKNKWGSAAHFCAADLFCEKKSAFKILKKENFVIKCLDMAFSFVIIVDSRIKGEEQQ